MQVKEEDTVTVGQQVASVDTDAGEAAVAPGRRCSAVLLAEAMEGSALLSGLHGQTHRFDGRASQRWSCML